MKFIPLLLVLGFITANSQITTASGAKVFVSSNTLVYSTGDITINPGTDKFTNYGNIRIAQGTVKSVSASDDSDGSVTGGTGRFVMAYNPIPSQDQYGQLIVASGTNASGIVRVEKPLNNAGDFSYFGTPFVGYTYAQFTKDLIDNQNLATTPELPCALFGAAPSGTLADCKNNGARWNRVPIFVYRNDRYRWDPYQGNAFESSRHYLVRQNQFTGAVFTSLHSFRGIPYVAPVAGITLPFPERVAGGYNVGDGRKNEYTVAYYTYLTDPFVTVPGGYSQTTTSASLNASGFADRMLWLANPYTSNIDVTKLIAANGFDGNNIVGIGSDGLVQTRETATTRYTGTAQRATVTGTGASVTLVGDNVQYIPPMTNFFIKAKVTGLNLTLNSSAQTFEKGYLFGGGTPVGRVAGTTTTTNTKTLKAAAKTTSTGTDVYQLNLGLKANDAYYNNTYVAAGANFVTGDNFYEAVSTEISDGNSGIFTVAEAPTGGAAPGLEDSKLYINVINTDAAKVAIPLGINLSDEDKGKNFTIYAKDLRVNQEYLPQGQTNFSNVDAKFYFHDKTENVVKEIDTNFFYNVTLNNSSTDRFEIFWKDAGIMGNEDIQTLTGVTTVYKTGSDYKVHFNQNWTKADVTIFNVLGQLISSEKNINTQNDYLLPINNSSSTMYLIVITNEKGEKVTKKIAK